MNRASVRAKTKAKTLVTIGIDEAGRGPLAGPVSVGACAVLDVRMARKIFGAVKESKQLTEQKREEWLRKMHDAQKGGIIRFAVSMTSATEIDKKGISSAIQESLAKSLGAVVKKSGLDTNEVKILLDGGLRAPKEYLSQKTIIKGDEKEMSIALASIVAKVERDRYMKNLAPKSAFIKYDFDVHKGYGTARHRDVIKRYGLSSEHRASFCRGVLLG